MNRKDTRMTSRFKDFLYSDDEGIETVRVSYNQHTGVFKTYDGKTLERSDRVVIDEIGKRYDIFQCENEDYLDTGFRAEEGGRLFLKIPVEILGGLAEEGSIRFTYIARRRLSKQYFEELAEKGMVRLRTKVSPREDGLAIRKLKGYFKEEQRLTDDKGNTATVLRNNKLDFDRNFILALYANGSVPDKPIFLQMGAGTLSRIVKDTQPNFSLTQTPTKNQQ
jgi:hypothetical protein